MAAVLFLAGLERRALGEILYVLDTSRPNCASILVVVVPSQLTFAGLFGAGVAALDMAACTLAGVATAAAGAHVNGDAVTSQLMSLGALAGAIKSGVRSFCVFVSLHTSSPATLSLKFLLFSWGLALFVTNAVVQRIMFPGGCDFS